MDQAPGIQLGHVLGAFGIKGWLKIYSYCRPKAQILEYELWQLRLEQGEKVYRLNEGKQHGNGIVVRLSGVDTRTAAEALRDAQIWVPAADLPPLPAGEYYWHQLIGLDVVTVAGQKLGKIEHLMETGAHDVLVITGEGGGGEILIPYVQGQVVKEVDPDRKLVTVDWQAEFS